MEGIRSFSFGLVGWLLVAASAHGINDNRRQTPPMGPALPFTSIETYGDSITAGFLSYTDVTAPPPLPIISKIMSDLARYIFVGDKTAIIQHHRADLAWPAQLGRTLGVSVVNNRAISGARVHELEGQVQRSRAGTKDTMAFFFIGHNDLCRNNSTPEQITEYFVEHYTKALQTWEKAHEGSTAYLMPVGDVYRVFQALRGYTWYSNGAHESRYTCEDSWEKLFPYCPSHAKAMKAGTLEEYLVPRQRAINEAVRKVAETFAASSRRNRYVFLDGVLAKPFETGYFAIDCYHLSPGGQAAVAKDVSTYILSNLD